MPKCSIKRCSNAAAGRGLCKHHYQKARRAGSLPVLLPKPTRAFLDAAMAGNKDECVLWPFCLDTKGYGVLEGRRAHRIACEERHGKPPKRKPLACHSCGVRQCINPNHLYWGTYKSNAEDSARHGTTARGEKSGHAKLTESDVAAVRRSKMGGRRLAKEYGVAPSLIWSIRQRRIWRHVD